jgi:hypothetical protein
MDFLPMETEINLKFDKRSITMNMNGAPVCGIEADDSECKRLLGRIAETWGGRAQVRRPELSLNYNVSMPDFIEDLLPFHKHPAYIKLNQAQKSRILSCGWLAYNEKTVAIEMEIVAPSCFDILAGRIPGLKDEVTNQIICETLVDESYHLLLVKNANKICRLHRNLESITIPQFNLVKYMELEKSRYPEEWKKILVQFATTVVSEIFVSDYLDLLSDDQEIQPLNRETVSAHRHDELAHSKIFKSLTRKFFPALNEVQKVFFAEALLKPVFWFADLELDLWRDILTQLDIIEADEIIEDSRELNKQAHERVNYTEIVTLAEEIGIQNMQQEWRPACLPIAENSLVGAPS